MTNTTSPPLYSKRRTGIHQEPLHPGLSRCAVCCLRHGMADSPECLAVFSLSQLAHLFPATAFSSSSDSFTNKQSFAWEGPGRVQVGPRNPLQVSGLPSSSSMPPPSPLPPQSTTCHSSSWQIRASEFCGWEGLSRHRVLGPTPQCLTQ